jgi:hypothetical protein
VIVLTKNFLVGEALTVSLITLFLPILSQLFDSNNE